MSRIRDFFARSVLRRMWGITNGLVTEIESLRAQRDRALELLDRPCPHPWRECNHCLNKQGESPCKSCKRKYILKGE